MAPSTPPAAGTSVDLNAPVYFQPKSRTPGCSGDPAGSPTGEPGIPPDPEPRGVRRAQLAALFAILGLGLGLIGPFVLLFVAGVTLPVLGWRFGTNLFTITTLETILGLFLAGSFLEVASFATYSSAFGYLRHVDDRFRVPRVLTIVGLIGFAMILLSVGVLLGLILQAVTCASAGGTATSCLDPSISLAAAGLAILGSILALVGWIGLVIGIYRAGSRYQSSLLKAGAILTVIPFVNIIAPILIFSGFHQVPGKFDLSSRPPETPELQ